MIEIGRPLADRVKDLYDIIGIPYSVIANRIGVDRSHICNYASGKSNLGIKYEEKLYDVISEIKEQMTKI